MAITYVGNQEDTNAAATSPQTISVNIGTRTNGLLVVSFKAYCGNNLSALSMTYNGVSLTAGTRKTRIISSPINYVAQHFYLVTPTNGTNDLVITWTLDFGSSFTAKHIVAMWFDGAKQDQATVLDQEVSGEGSTDPSVDITPSEDNELIIGSYFSAANNVLSVGSGETLINDWDAGSYVMGDSYVIQTAAGAQTVDFSGVDDNWIMVASSFRQYAAAAAASLAPHRKGANMAGLLVR